MQVLSYTVLAEGGTGLSQYLGGAVDTATLAAGISSFAPIVVAWITKKEASNRVKAVINLLAVAVASVVALIWNGSSDGAPITWQLVAATFVSGLVTSIVAYQSIWKPLLVTKAIANATENFGVGTATSATEEGSKSE